MNIKKLFEKTSTGFKEFVAKVDFANVIGIGEELAKFIRIDDENKANVNYVDSTRNKRLIAGYNGITYVTYDSNNNLLKTHIYDNIANFSYTNANSGYVSSTTMTYNGFKVEQFSRSNKSSTTYAAKNIRKDDFTYTFPDKSGTIELVDEEKDNKLNHIELVEGTNNNTKFCNFASSFKSFEELAEYVNNNKGKITEAYTIINDETNTYYVSLGTDGALVMAQSGLNGFVITYSHMEDSDITIPKTLGFDDEKAIFPSNLKLITDSNELYFLNLERCIELGIVAKDNTTV
nr:MAG TPA: hypothetical protein [Crassvirales sp.]